MKLMTRRAFEEAVQKRLEEDNYRRYVDDRFMETLRRMDRLEERLYQVERKPVALTPVNAAETEVRDG